MARLPRDDGAGAPPLEAAGGGGGPALSSALDVVAAHFPRDTLLALRARDAASARDPGLRFLAELTFRGMFYHSAEAGDVAAVDRILRARHALTATDKARALVRAARAGCDSVVERILVEPDVDASTENNAAVLAACARGELRTVERLCAAPRVRGPM
jgi:ankyrin repeat protein